LDADFGLPSAPQWTVTGTGEDVEQFRTSATGHLFAAGRYDGMDLDGDECRLVVVPACRAQSTPRKSSSPSS
jgi:hypothetical protein